MQERRSLLVLLALSLMLGLALRSVEIARKPFFLHAESISAQAATGHQAEYLQRAPFGEWVPAERFHEYLQIDAVFPLGTIRHDLAHHDIHPPLYFWLLHAWMLLFGSSPFSGVILNALLDVITLLLVISIGRRLLGTQAAGLATGALWFVGIPAVLASTGEARQYALLSTLTAAQLLFIVRTLLPDRARGMSWRDALLVTLSATLGMLTHYSYFLFVLAVGAAIFVLCIRHRWRLVAQFAAAYAAAFGMFAALFPQFHLHFGSSGASSFSVELFMRTFLRVPLAFLNNGLSDSGLSADALTAVTGLFVVALISLGALQDERRWLHGLLEDLRSNSPRRILPLVASLALLTLYAGCVAAGIFPRHSVGLRHTSLLWLPIALLLISFFGIPKERPRRRFAFHPTIVLFIVLSLNVAVEWSRAVERVIGVPEAIANTPYVLVDGTPRGYVPLTLNLFSPQTRVFVQTPDGLLADEAWLEPLEAGHELLYISMSGNAGKFYADEEGASKIADRLARDGRYRVEISGKIPLLTRIANYAPIYRIRLIDE